MRRLLPRTLAGRLIALLLLALFVSHAVSLALLASERRHAVRAADRAQVLTRTASVVRLLGETPPELSEAVIATASSRRLAYWLAGESAVDPAEPAHSDNPLADRLAALLDGSRADTVLVRIEDRLGGLFAWREGPPPWAWRHHRDDEDDGAWRGRREPPFHRRAGRPRGALSLAIAVRLEDGRWLNAETLLPPRPRVWAWTTLGSMVAMAMAITLIVVLSVRRITRPLRALSTAADRFGRGEDVEPLAEAGPEEVRRTTRAFNDMRARLRRFVQDRTQMLAAISHDLRTPITSLRLRAEFIDDEETRSKVLQTLDEMQQMTEAALAFAREDAAREETRLVDLAALLDSLCDDLAEAGLDVTLAETERTPHSCRPHALRRALGNLIENGVAYGSRARVSLRRDGSDTVIVVDDDGPGIPQAERERVFEPFVRLEASRSRDTGGVGLGLAIARSIVRAHGGDITLDNRPEGGLRASVRLPGGKSA